MLNGLAAILASLGFGVLFNVRGKKLAVAAIVGGVGGLTYEFVFGAYGSAAEALFWAACAISIASEVSARIFKCPVTMFLICAMIPLVPGGGMYYTMLEVINKNYTQAISLGFETIIQACAIVIGVTLISSITRMLVNIKAKRKEAHV